MDRPARAAGWNGTAWERSERILRSLTSGHVDDLSCSEGCVEWLHDMIDVVEGEDEEEVDSFRLQFKWEHWLADLGNIAQRRTTSRVANQSSL